MYNPDTLCPKEDLRIDRPKHCDKNNEDEEIGQEKSSYNHHHHQDNH